MKGNTVERDILSLKFKGIIMGTFTCNSN